MSSVKIQLTFHLSPISATSISNVSLFLLLIRNFRFSPCSLVSIKNEKPKKTWSTQKNHLKSNLIYRCIDFETTEKFQKNFLNFWIMCYTHVWTNRVFETPAPIEQRKAAEEQKPRRAGTQSSRRWQRQGREPKYQKRCSLSIIDTYIVTADDKAWNIRTAAEVSEAETTQKHRWVEKLKNA